MHNIRYIFYTLLACLCFACTSEELEMGQHESGFCLTLSDDVTVTTRMTPAELGAPVAAQFSVKVTNKSTGRSAYDGSYTEFVNAGAGSYKLVATYGEDKALAINAPYYKGEAEASITKSEPTPSVTIPCRVANSLLSVRYLNREGKASTDFDKCFSSYHVRVSVGSTAATLQAPGQSAYFRAGTMPKVTFVGTLADTKREVEYDIPAASLPESLNAAEHLIVSLSLKEAAAGIVLEVAKADVQAVTVAETIPIEWLPKPKVSAFGGDGQLYYIETTEPTDEASIEFATSHKLQDVELTLSFADEPLASALNGTYVLSSLTAEQSDLLASYGVQLPEAGQQYAAGKIDLRGMVRHLLTHDGETVDNTVAVRVKANDRWSSDEPQQFTISAVRPVFNMPAQQPGYAWAHSLYVTPLAAADIVDAKGANPQDLVASAVYDISTDGGETWTEVTGQQDNLYFVNGLDANTEYVLRARVGSVMTSANTATATTEEEQAVPNGDFENLHQTIKISKMTMGGRYQISLGFIKAWYQNTVTFTISEPDGWSSLNALTCNYDGAANKNSWFVVPSTFNTNCSASMFQHYGEGASGTTHTEADHFINKPSQNGANAMVLQNVAWSLRGNTPADAPNSGGMIDGPFYCKNVPTGVDFTRTAGELFLKDDAGEGCDYNVRPTALNFYYNYDNLKDNNEKGVAQVELLAGNAVIGTGSAKLSAQSEFKYVTVPIVYSNPLLKATRLRIKFISSDATSIRTEDVTNFEQCSYGATLIVDNLTFTYDK